MANHIESISCNLQVIDSLLPSIPDTPIVSKAITPSSRQNCLTCLEDELVAPKTVSKLDDSSHQGDDLDPSLKPRCMTTLDWVEAQSKDKTIGKIISLFKAKELQCQKGKETDSQDMKQFIRQ